MKIHNLTPMLLGGLLALQENLQSSAQPYVAIVGEANSLSLASGSNRRSDFSGLPNWIDSGLEVSSLDGSSMFCSVQVIHGEGLFSGSGYIRLRSGTYAGVPSIDVAGNTTIYIRLQLTNDFRYVLTSSVIENGNVVGQVVFASIQNNGQASGTQPLLTSGLLAMGDYDLIAGMSDDRETADGNGSWSYNLSLTPAFFPIGKLTATEKHDFYIQAGAIRILKMNLLNAADSTSSDNERNALLAAANGLDGLYKALLQDVLDPPDTNFTFLAQVVAPVVIPLAADSSVTQPEADAYNAWQTNVSQSAAYCAALTTSLNRAQGAGAAGSSYWETAQMNAAVQFEAQLASLLDQEPALRSNVVAQFQAGGFQSITVTTNDAINLQMQISTNGLPAVLLDGLTALGVDPNTITNLQNELLTADPSTMAGGFPGSLVNTYLDSATRTAAADLRDASLMLINAVLLPGGQFRFDLPTEPGYTYTIQFSQNLADPAGWTTLFATNATTPLLSFTNTPAAGAPAGFYRASHN